MVTTWQRSFQTTIGKNHAKYFDANGWLYFTKEYFDLFYPAYGDTYPMYNGSIGMTYEQAGHSMGGLAIQVNDDTLTLYDRIAHHFTTSMSTIEVASLHAVSIQKEFKKYFDDNKEKGSGKYLSYLLIGGNKNKLSTLIELFDRNDIGYAYAKAGVKINGFHYDNGKEENYTAAAGDIIITAKQPKASLIKVLFEPQSKLADSSTYDITAWSLPYAYGIDCFATTEAIVTEVNMPVNAEPSISRDLYAYLIDYHSVNEGKLLASLLKYGFNVRFAEKDFMYNGKKFDKGTLVILKVNNAAKMDALIALSKQYHAGITGVPSGFMDSGFDFGSDKLRLIKKPVVAMLTGESVSAGSIGEVWHFFEQELDYPIILLQADNIASINLKSIDVLIIPDGDYKILTEKESVLKTWVKQGGKIIACENAVSQMAAGDWGVKIKTDDSIKSDVVKNNYADLKKYGDRDRQSIVNNTPGAIYKVEMDATHPLAFGYPDYYFMLKLNSHLMEFMKDGWNVGVLRNEHEVAGFVGSEARKIIKDGAVIAVQSLGNGNVTYFTDDPLFRSFWENGKLLFINAVFLVGQ